jgi:hypothetical protein
MPDSNSGTIPLMSFYSAAGVHSPACILYVPSPFVDTGKATQTNFGHQSLFLTEDTSLRLCN